MSYQSNIEWTETTWNPVTGCTKISPGCANCYAERLAKRLHVMGNPSYRNGFQVTLHERLVHIPLKWASPRIIFVNSMSDLFHEQIPISFIKKIFTVMYTARQHTFQILTKRSSRLAEISKELAWPENVWMGVSVESADYLYRIDNLRIVPSAIKFVSFEPLLSSMPNINLDRISWAIVGGESGPGARPIKQDWVIDIRDQCLKAKVPFFFKQWGGVFKKRAGRKLQGRTWSQMPQLPQAI